MLKSEPVFKGFADQKGFSDPTPAIDGNEMGLIITQGMLKNRQFITPTGKQCGLGHCCFLQEMKFT